MSAEMLPGVAWTVVLSAAGLCVVLVGSMAALLWVRSVSPKDVRLRLDTLEAGLQTLKDEVRRTREREKSARRRAVDVPADEPTSEDAEPVQNGERPAATAAALAALRARHAR